MSQPLKTTLLIHLNISKFNGTSEIDTVFRTQIVSRYTIRLKKKKKDARCETVNV